MASLTDRLLNIAGKKIPVHQFMAIMGELERGQVTRNQIVNKLALDTEGQNELDALISVLDGKVGIEKFKFVSEVHDVLLLGEAGYLYTDKESLRTRLGI